MDIKINASWFRFLEDLPAEEIKKVVHAIWDYTQGNKVQGIKSAAWETIKASIDFEIQHKAELSAKRRKAAQSRWDKENIVSEQPTPEIQTEVIEPEIIVPENKFISLTDNFEVRTALENPGSAISVFLETGARYDELSTAEREFVDRADVRKKCAWHKEIQAATKEIKKKPFTPPTIEEWLDFCREKNLNLDKMRNAYDGYVAANWHDTKGNPIRNWKQKILMVWMQNSENYNKQSARFPQKSGIAELMAGSEMAKQMLKERGLL